MVLLAACSSGPGASAEPAADVATAVLAGSMINHTVEPVPSHTRAATRPPPPSPPAKTATMEATEAPPSTVTPPPTTAPTVTPAPSLTPTTAPTNTPKPSPTTEPGRYCPEISPLKPEYNRFYLSAKKWPAPDENIAEEHFWMSRPLPGAGRMLTNQRFPYGWDDNGRLLLHTGADTAEDLGTPLLAVADGTIVVAQSDHSAWYGWRCDWYGHLVVLELDDRWQDQPVYALYGHVLNINVEAGDKVSRGEQVAEIGFGGAATNPHLHFEVRVGENQFANTRNPMLWLDPGPSRGVIAGRLVDPEGRPWQGVLIALINDDNNADIAPTWSYLGDPQSLMNPDEGWAENFVFSDVPPGSYHVLTQIQGVEYQVPVQVAPGEVSVVEIQTEQYKTPTPEPPAEADPSPTEPS